MDKDLMHPDVRKALEALEGLHAAIWVHFDPDYTKGDEKQPKDIKEALKHARVAARKLGYKFDGWER